MKSISQKKIILFHLMNVVSTTQYVWNLTKKKQTAESFCICLDVLKNLEATIVIVSPSADTDIMVHIIVTIE